MDIPKKISGIISKTAKKSFRTFDTFRKSGRCQGKVNRMGDLIDRQAAINKFIDELDEIFADLRKRHVDGSVCGLCEYNGAYLGQSGNWCNECPGFEKDDCFKLSGKIRKKWTDEIIKALSSAQPEEDCYTCKHGHFGDAQCERCRVRYPNHYERRTDG